MYSKVKPSSVAIYTTWIMESLKQAHAPGLEIILKSFQWVHSHIHASTEGKGKKKKLKNLVFHVLFVSESVFILKVETFNSDNYHHSTLH